jgi:hypothetical protein
MVLSGEGKNNLVVFISDASIHLAHLQSISRDVSGVTGDAKTRTNLKQIIESLSRLVTE